MKTSTWEVGIPTHNKRSVEDEACNAPAAHYAPSLLELNLQGVPAMLLL
jgi:hypothetical protein